MIRCELAGVDRRDVELSFTAGTLVVWGERVAEPDQDGTVEYYVRERRYGPFSRTINFPEGIDTSRIGATFEDGLLEITVRGAAASQDVEEIPISDRDAGPVPVEVHLGRRAGRGRIVMTRRKRIAQALVMAVLALAVVSACGDAGDETGGSQPQGLDLNVTLGTKNFDEQFLLGQLYKQALGARGYKVTLKENIGATEVIDASLQRGEIDGYPEYLGVTATVLGARTSSVRMRSRPTESPATSTPREARRSASRRASRTSTRSRPPCSTPSATASNRSPTFASCPTSPSAPDRSSRTASRACRACSRPTG